MKWLSVWAFLRLGAASATSGGTELLLDVVLLASSDVCLFSGSALSSARHRSKDVCVAYLVSCSLMRASPGLRQKK